MIRRAGERALAAGMRTARCLEVLAETRERVAVPLIPMTYSSILDAYGWERFAPMREDAGATSLIVADLPRRRPAGDAAGPARRTDVDRRAAPPRRRVDRRLAVPRDRDRHTGARTELAPTLAPLAERARAATTKPLYAGFGISTGAQARAAAALVDGIVVGSAAVEAAEQGAAELDSFVAQLRAALDSA